MTAGADRPVRCRRVSALFEEPRHPTAAARLDAHLGGGAVVLTRREYDADGRQRRSRIELLANVLEIASAIAACEETELHDLGEELLSCGAAVGYDPRALDAEACRLAGLPAPDESPDESAVITVAPLAVLPLVPAIAPASGGREP